MNSLTIVQLVILLEEKGLMDAINADLEEAVAEKSVTLDQILNKRKSDEERIKQLRQNNQSIQSLINEQNALLKEKTPIFKQARLDVETAKQAITQENLKKIYEFLSKKSSEPITYIVEAFVGLMRNMRRADTKSVELYFRSYDGLLIGLNRLEFKKLNKTHVDEHVEAMTKHEPVIKGHKEFEFFIPLLSLFRQLLVTAKHGAEIAAIEDEI